MSDPKHPHQPIVTVGGVTRFKRNAIVCALVEAGRRGTRLDLNHIATMDFFAEDRVQFAELIGYSVCGLGELSYVSDGAYAEATAGPVDAAAAVASEREAIAAMLEDATDHPIDGSACGAHFAAQIRARGTP